jgi:hypothetical protein
MVLGVRYLLHLLTKGQVQVDVARLIPPELVQLLTAGLADFGAAVSFLALLLDLIRQADGKAPKPRHDIKAVLINIILTYACTRQRQSAKPGKISAAAFADLHFMVAAGLACVMPNAMSWNTVIASLQRHNWAIVSRQPGSSDHEML